MHTGLLGAVPTGYLSRHFRAVGLLAPRGLHLRWAFIIGLRGSVLVMEDSLKSGLTLIPGYTAPSPSQEVRCAVRFPLSLPVVVSAGNRELDALTQNVSASGVLFEMTGPLKVGEGIHFSLRMPGAVLGTPHDVLVDCHGRVVRCSMSQSQSQVAVTIDDYQFVEL